MISRSFKPLLFLLSLVLVCSSGCCSFNLDSLIASLSGSEVKILPDPMTNQRLSSDPRLAGRRPQRVLMVAAGRSDGSYASQQKMIAELASQFRQRQMFEVVTPRNVRMKSHSNNITQGRFDEAELANLARDYRADAVAIVSVNEFKSSVPMRVALSVAIVDSAETVVMAASDSMWDLGDPVVREHFDDFVDQSLSASSVEKPLLHHSPNVVLRFIAANVVQEIRQSGL